MLALALALFWPLLQLAPQGRSTLPRSAYKELSTRWDSAGAIETGLSNTAFVSVCPSDLPDAGQLIVADSAGQLVEMRYGPDGWTKVRSFSVGEPITAGCAGAPHLDRKWRMYVGTQSGKIIEFTRGNLGWTNVEIQTLVPPVKEIVATNPGSKSISQLFLIDGDGRVLNMWLTETDKWILRLVPEVDGGASRICYDISSQGLTAIIAGSKGTVYKFGQDSTGHWNGGPWATMPAGPLDMANSADPSMKDIAVFYSGTDGFFRYLFANHTNDEQARIPIAEAANYLIGKGPERRFNEFFGMSAGDFCMFEFNFATREWDRVPMGKIPSRVVSTAFGPGREEPPQQIFVATIDGAVYEFTRGYVEPDFGDN